MIRDLKAVVKRNGTNSVITIHKAILDVHKIEYGTVFDIETYTENGRKIIKLIERFNEVLEMKIVHVQYPFVITDNGEKIEISDIEGNVAIGVSLKITDDGYKVDGAASEICEV